MSSNMATPYKTLFIILEILKFLKYSYFAKIRKIRKPKIGNLTNVTELYPFLESKKWFTSVTSYTIVSGVLRDQNLIATKKKSKEQNNVTHRRRSIDQNRLVVTMYLPLHCTFIKIPFYFLSAPLLSMLSSNNTELIYTCLCHIELLLQRSPQLFDQKYKTFFSRY